MLEIVLATQIVTTMQIQRHFAVVRYYWDHIFFDSPNRKECENWIAEHKNDDYYVLPCWNENGNIVRR